MPIVNLAAPAYRLSAAACLSPCCLANTGPVLQATYPSWGPRLGLPLLTFWLKLWIRDGCMSMQQMPECNRVQSNGKE